MSLFYNRFNQELLFIKKMKQAGQQIKHFFQDLKQLVQFLFSYDGKLNVVQFIMVILMVRALFHPFGAQVKYLPQISYWLDLASFYCVIAAVQKRCRDFGSRGTWWILAVSFVMVANEACHFLDAQQVEGFWKNINLAVFMGQIMAFLPLFFIPSKQDTGANLRSPLLKYPLLYVGVCWVVTIAGTLAVNYLAGIEVALF